MTKAMEIGSEFTKEGLAKLKTGQVLVFDFEGSRNEFKITKINRKSHKLFVKPCKLLTEQEMTEKWNEVRNA
jgi:hypothetical protein